MWTVTLGNDKLARVTVDETELVAEAGRVSRSPAAHRPLSGPDERPVSVPAEAALAELLAELHDLRVRNAELYEKAGRTDRLEGELAAELRRSADLRQDLEHERAEKAVLRAELAELRRPLLLRLLEVLKGARRG